MLIYPFAIQFTFKYFEDPLPSSRGSGLRRGILIGAVLNAMAGGIRWIGSIPSPFGFIVLFLGQTVAAVGTYKTLNNKRRDFFSDISV